MFCVKNDESLAIRCEILILSGGVRMIGWIRNVQKVSKFFTLKKVQEIRRVHNDFKNHRDVSRHACKNKNQYFKNRSNPLVTFNLVSLLILNLNRFMMQASMISSS